jgi:hypothetical protein
MTIPLHQVDGSVCRTDVSELRVLSMRAVFKQALTARTRPNWSLAAHGNQKVCLCAMTFAPLLIYRGLPPTSCRWARAPCPLAARPKEIQGTTKITCLS